MKNGWKIAYLIVYDTMKYDRNTAHTKRVKYDEKQPFTTGLISPGHRNVIDVSDITKEPLLTVANICKGPSHTVADTLATHHRL